MSLPQKYSHITILPGSTPVRVSRREKDRVVDTTHVRVGVAYVLFKISDTRTRATRFMTAADPVPGVRIGSSLDLTSVEGVFLGQYMIVGVIDYENNEQAGDIPDHMMAACRLA